jgi:hypothetical protein
MDSKTAYNASTGKLVNPSRNSKANSFNPFQDSPGTNPSVIHTVFSPNGQYFAYVTTEGFIGILNFKLLDPESSLIEKDEKKRSDDEYWEKLALGSSKKNARNMGGIIYFGSEKDSRLLYISAAYYCQIRSLVLESKTLRTFIL